MGGRGVNLVRIVKLTILPTELGARVRLLGRTVLSNTSVRGSREVTGRGT